MGTEYLCTFQGRIKGDTSPLRVITQSVLASSKDEARSLLLNEFEQVTSLFILEDETYRFELEASFN